MNNNELKAIKAEIGGLKAEKKELQVELRELGVVAIHGLEGEIERADADLGAAASAAMKADALAEHMEALTEYGEINNHISLSGSQISEPSIIGMNSVISCSILMNINQNIWRALD